MEDRESPFSDQGMQLKAGIEEGDRVFFFFAPMQEGGWNEGARKNLSSRERGRRGKTGCDVWAILKRTTR